MFKRSDSSYEIANVDEVVAKELENVGTPLGQISKMVAGSAKVLDVGAGNGILADLLRKKNPSLIIDGIEPNSHAAALAGNKYRRFHVGFVQEFLPVIKQEDYDYIVLVDVIEHMPDPLEFLRTLSSILSKKTKVILSTPNVAFGAVKLALFAGLFEYTDSGILERTHLRFFTYKTLRELISKSGLNAEKVVFLRRSFLESETRIENVRINPILFREARKDPFSTTYQFLVVLTTAPCNPEETYIGDGGRFIYLRYFLLRHKNAYIVRSVITLYRKAFGKSGSPAPRDDSDRETEGNT